MIVPQTITRGAAEICEVTVDVMKESAHFLRTAGARDHDGSALERVAEQLERSGSLILAIAADLRTFVATYRANLRNMPS